MTAEKRDNIFGAIYRELDELADAVRKNTEALERLAQIALRDAERAVAREPEQQTLPGLPAEDWTPPAIEVKPRDWCNCVKVYDWIANAAGTDGRYTFCLDDLFAHADEIAERTAGKIGVASYTRILSTLVRAGALKRGAGRRGRYEVVPPTDELREAVEQTAKKRTAAKEVSA